MSFLGGTCSILIAVTFPSILLFFILFLVACYVKTNDRKWNSPYNLFLIIANVILTCLCYTAAILSLLSSMDIYQLPKV
jgi:hypothetical protein